MKSLTLIRHAKAQWIDPVKPDFERSLIERGILDAVDMAKTIRKQFNVPDIIFASPAVRAKETAFIFAKEFLYPGNEISFKQEMYTGDASVLLHLVKNIADIHSEVYLIGHNPGLSELIQALVPDTVISLPTCGVCRIEFQIGRWKELKSPCGKVASYEFPAMTS